MTNTHARFPPTAAINDHEDGSPLPPDRNEDVMTALGNGSERDSTPNFASDSERPLADPSDDKFEVFATGTVACATVDR